jgi:hypothetical protein
MMMHSLRLVFSPIAAMDEQEQGQDSSDCGSAVTCHCQADAADPLFPARLKYKTCKLHRLMDDGKSEKSDVNRSEHCNDNSVRVSFNMPHDAARRLRRLAESADPILRDMGITSVQFDGSDQVCVFTFPTRSLSHVCQSFAGHYVNVKQLLVADGTGHCKPDAGQSAVLITIITTAAESIGKFHPVRRHGQQRKSHLTRPIAIVTRM